MQITHLKFNNFKGRSFDSELAPMTLITGDNFSAKTSIPMAIRLGLAGYLPPPIGQKGIYQLAGNPDQPGSMDLQLTIDNSRVVFWSWTRDEKGKVKVLGNIPRDIAMPEILMEPRLFFQQTAAERTATVFRCCDVSKIWTGPDPIVNRFIEVNEPPMAICDATKEEIIRRMYELKDETPQKFCELLLDYLTSTGRVAAQEAKHAQGAFAAFKSTADSGPPARNVAKQLEEKQAELAQLLAASRNVNVKEEIERLKARLKAYNVDTLLPDLHEWETIKNPVPDEPDVEEALQEARIAQADSKDTITKAQFLYDSAVGKIQDLEDAKCCPTCGAASKKWKDRALKDAYADRDNREHELLEATKAHTAAVELFTAIEGYLSAQAKLAQAKAVLNDYQNLEQRILELERQPQTAPDNTALIATTQAEVNRLQEEQSRFLSSQKDRQRRAWLEQETVKHTCRADTFRAIAKIVTEEQSKLVDRAFGAVLKSATRLTDGLLNSNLEYQQGKLGRRVSDKDIAQGCKAKLGSWVSHEAFSGTEELLAYAAFSVALTADAPVKIVILDELGRLGPNRKRGLLERLSLLIAAEEIDQAVLVDVSERDYEELCFEVPFLKIALMGA